MEAGDDAELARLRALDERLVALHNARWDDPPLPGLEIAIDALESEAAALIRARSDRALAPILRRMDAALVVAHHLLGMPPPKDVSIGYGQALAYLRSLESEGDTAPSPATPPARR